MGETISDSWLITAGADLPNLEGMLTTTAHAPSQRARSTRLGTLAIALGASTAMLLGCVSDVQGDEEPEPTPEPIGTPDAQVTEAAQAMLDGGATAVVVEVRNGDDVTQLTLGEADVEEARDAAAADPLRVASVTKTAVAIAVMDLVDEGSVDLDTSVHEYLPEVLGARDDVTVRQLLNHTSGLPDYTAPMYADLEGITTAQEASYSEEELVDLALEQDWLDEPGEEFHYSNTNYVVLGMLIAEVTGEETTSVLQSTVFDPAQMADTQIPTDATMPDIALRGYMTVDGEQLDMTEFSPDVPSWGASMVSTVPDVTSMMQALNRGELVSYSNLGEMRDLGTSGYGLGILGGPDPCEPMTAAYGQRGNGFGYNTASFSSADGERVTTVSWTGGTDDPGTDPLLPASAEVINAGLGAGCA